MKNRKNKIQVWGVDKLIKKRKQTSIKNTVLQISSSQEKLPLSNHPFESSQNFNQSDNYYEEPHAVEESVVPTYRLPLANKKTTFLLSTPLDPVQGFCVYGEGKNEKSLVVITKAAFGDKFNAIVGCSLCGGVMAHFMAFYVAETNEGREIPHIFRCTHIRSAISCLLDNNGRYKREISMNEAHDLIATSIINENVNDSIVFFNEEIVDLCGSLIPTYGLFLFLRKAGSWRCYDCNERIYNRCVHGQLTILPDSNIANPILSTVEPIGLSRSPVLSSSRIDCECRSFLFLFLLFIIYFF